MNKPKAVLFDVDDTLYGRVQPFIRTCETLLSPRIQLDWVELYRVRNIYSDEVFEASQKGDMSMEDMYVYRLSNALNDFGYDITREEVIAFDKQYERFQGEIVLDNLAPAYLTRLKDAGIELGIITNGPSAHQRNKITSLNIESWIPREHWCISGEVETVKPHKEIFEKGLHMINQTFSDLAKTLSPADCWFVGDNFELDVMASKAAGFTAVWFNRRKEALPENAPFSPDFQVENAKEFLALVESVI